LRPEIPGDLTASGFHSQYGQDKWVAESLLPDVLNGTFVDIGAHDGITYSNTYYLEQVRGWTGIAVEPHPAVYKMLRENRNCRTVNACVGARSGTKIFLAISGYCEMLSGVMDEYHPDHLARIDAEISRHGGSRTTYEIECLTLNDIFGTYGVREIDYMTIDVEGSELSILQAIDWTRVRIKVIGVENNYQDFRIPRLLISQGYKFHSILGVDEFYVLEPPTTR
jgi:FkbM family methyltransferase